MSIKQAIARFVIGAAAVALCLVGAPQQIWAQEMESHHHHMDAGNSVQPPEDQSVSRLSIPDVRLIDQSGRPVAFYTDLVKGKVVAINFIYTTCPTICSPLAATFVGLQKVLKTLNVPEVKLISISVDPATDTPERLKAWSEQFKPDAGWTLLTGETPEVTRLLKALQVYTADKESHSPIVIVGNDAKGKWVRAYGLAPPSKLGSIVEDVVK